MWRRPWRRCRPRLRRVRIIVRVSVPDEASSKALKEIVRESPVPIVADIHFHYRRGIEAAEAGAACLRINPGNIGDEKRVKEVIKAARDHNCSIRIGVNAGSLEKHLLEKYGEPLPRGDGRKSGLEHIRILQDNDFHDFKISRERLQRRVPVRSGLSGQLPEATDAPIHLGITEAGGLCLGYNQIRNRSGQACCGWALVTRSASACPPTQSKR